MTYEQPAAAEKFSPRDHPEWLHKLFIIVPTAVEDTNFTDEKTGQPTPGKAVNADLAIVDLIDPQTGQPTVLKGARIYGKGLVPQLAPRLGSKALGRLKQLPAQGSKSGAYVLDNFTDADAAQAGAYEAANPNWQGAFTQPVAAQSPTVTPPPPPPVAQPAPVAAPAAAAPWWIMAPDGLAIIGKLEAAQVPNARTIPEADARAAALALG